MFVVVVEDPFISGDTILRDVAQGGISGNAALVWADDALDSSTILRFHLLKRANK